MRDLPHGTRGAYARGCRCDECREHESRMHADYYARNRETILERHRQWREDHPESFAEYTARWKQNNQEAADAHQRVKCAVRGGTLTRGACEVCGSDNTHAHHDDYSKPLIVRWLCPEHHGIEHRKWPT